jgi:hypothetical protein
MHTVFAKNPPDWLPADEWMVHAAKELLVRWAIDQIEPEARPEAVRRRRVARRAAEDEEE